MMAMTPSFADADAAVDAAAAAGRSWNGEAMTKARKKTVKWRL